MLPLTAGSKDKTWQDAMSWQAGCRASTEDNLSKNNNTSEKLFRLVIGWRHIRMPEKSKELFCLIPSNVTGKSRLD